jgi:hypothetical protein
VQADNFKTTSIHRYDFAKTLARIAAHGCQPKPMFAQRRMTFKQKLSPSGDNRKAPVLGFEAAFPLGLPHDD